MKTKLSDSKQRISFPIRLFQEGEIDQVAVTDEIHVVPVGEWEHPYYGPMKITTSDIAEFIKNFKDKVRRDIPITAGHDNGGNGGELPAIGWFKELYDRGVNGLYAFVEWTEEGKTLLKSKAFKYFSPEFYEVYSDPETGVSYNHVLVGGALTNKPYFKELEPVVSFSEPGIINQFSEEKSMNIKDILAKKVADLTDEEKTFLVEHKDELTDDQKTEFASVVGSTEGETEEEKTAREAKEQGDANEAAGLNRDGSAKETTPTPQVDASEKKIMMSESEATALRAKADQGAQAFAELEAMKITASVDLMVFSEKNKEGSFAPKQKDSVVSFMKSLSEVQRVQFSTIVANMPKVSLFKEIGDGEAAGSDAAKAVETAVQKLMSETKKSYSVCLKQVFKENPDLEKRYNESLSQD